MGPDMNPRLAVAAEGELGRAVDVIFAGEDRQDDTRDDYRLCRQALEDADREKLFVAAEAACVDSDRVVPPSDPDHSRYGEPPCPPIPPARKRQREPANPDHENETQKQLTKCKILRQTPAKKSH